MVVAREGYQLKMVGGSSQGRVSAEDDDLRMRLRKYVQQIEVEDYGCVE